MEFVSQIHGSVTVHLTAKMRLMSTQNVVRLFLAKVVDVLLIFYGRKRKVRG